MHNGKVTHVLKKIIETKLTDERGRKKSYFCKEQEATS